MTEWRAVPGYEGLYEVSDDGQVRSLPRFHVRRERILALTSKSAGYPHVRLCRTKASQISFKVHVLVARAFIGLPSPGQEIRHLNGDRMDNRLDNLCYGTRAENVQDAVRHGTQWKVALTHCPHGHPYDDTNTGYARGHKDNFKRVCLTCQVEWRKRKVARSALARAAAKARS